MEFVKEIFIDLSIVSCSEKRFGPKWSIFLGFVYRFIELGIVSGLPPFIVIYTHTKYKTVIAAVVSFFGMKFFKKLIEALSEDSIPTQLKKLRESNSRLEESNSRLETAHENVLKAISNLPEEIQQTVKGEIIKVNEESVERERQITNNQLSVIREDIDCNLSVIREDIDSIRPMHYAPYDSPSNGD